MESEHKEDGNKQVSEDVAIHSEETASVILLSETHSRSSSSSSSSSSYSSPHKNLPESIDDEAEISSPPVQVMERDDNSGPYDPHRIPSSVFARNQSNIPAEWSCASNESLFSIHLGHNSFSVHGNDLMRSGELYKSGELLAYSPALPMPPPPGSELEPLEEGKVFVDSDQQQLVLEKIDIDEDKRESSEKEQPPAVSWKTPTTSYRSNHSSNSAHSFSFPILAGAANESGKKKTEAEEQKKQAKESEESPHTPAGAEAKAEAENQKQSMVLSRWFSCFPPCPWCCSSRPPWSCS